MLRNPGSTIIYRDPLFYAAFPSVLVRPDGELSVYGYRHPPYSIRARLLDGECRNLGKETVLCDDGGNGDLGYPWACVSAEGRILVVYCLNVADGTRLQMGQQSVER
jgi:hypothetical protein